MFVVKVEQLVIKFKKKRSKVDASKIVLKELVIYNFQQTQLRGLCS